MTGIWERLFIGSLQDAERLVRKNPCRIATVITLCEQSVEDKAEDVSYIHLPIEDDEPVPPDQFERVMDSIAVNIQGGNVLVNRALGLSRSTTLTAAYMHRVGYKHFNFSLAEIEQLRPIVELSDTLLGSVKENRHDDHGDESNPQNPAG
jgi:hypothetical protein